MNENVNSEITIDDLLLIEGGGGLVIETDNVTTEEPKSEGEVVLPKVEEKPEEPKSEEKPEEVKVEEVKGNTTPDFYTNMSKKLLDEGKWYDVVIEVDGKEVKLSDATDIDEEVFFQIYEAQETAKKEDIDKNYVKISAEDTNSRRLINIINNGGDLAEIFEKPENIVRPFENWNLEDEANQAKILYWQLTNNQKLSSEDATELVKKAQKDLSLDSKAQQIVKHFQDRFDKNLEETEKRVIESKQAEELAIKDFRKNLSSLYKTEGITESLSKRLIDAATKKDENGSFFIDSKYEEIMQDPQRAKDLIFFILEPENYLKAKGASLKKAEQIDMMTKVKIIRDNSGKTVKKEEEPDNKMKSPFDDVVFE